MRDLSKKPEFKDEIKDLDKDHPNVLNIFFDTVSRNRLYRIMPKTIEFFRKYLPSKGKSKVAYEFFRLHSIRPYTEPNLKASLYGTDNPPLHSRRIDTEYRDSGYVTGEAYNSCSTSAKFTNCKFYFF